MADRISTQRKRFRLGDPDGLYTLSEGNPGALTVIMAAAKHLPSPQDFMFLLSLDDMNIRGPQIWVAYKDICGGNLTKLAELVERRDADLVAAVNLTIPDGERAVTSGASFAHV
ncbi:hypothetical protein ACFZ8E_24895 [Methylobacterium sp. HMF5984]|uniref:hypothetical protein n=1 Tax=Methylobacterium sp. HMF5984 TaxID=3367370 RepID=UPI003852360B